MMKICVSVVLVAVAFLATGASAQINDVSILNFALNLEYLEAEFYSWAVNGAGIPTANRLGGPASVGGEKCPISRSNLGFAEEIAEDELDHVKFLQLALGSAAVPMPLINIGSAFAAAADAALGTTLSPPFSPYRRSGNDLLFLHGAFIFEDVGVTAYAGAANLLSSKNNLQYAARILAVEAYHAGTIRTLLFKKAATKVAPYGVPVSTIVQAIAELRASVTGGGNDQGIISSGKANIVPTNGNGLVYKRTAAQIITIVTLGGANNQGGFFPSGLNGDIK